MLRSVVVGGNRVRHRASSFSPMRSRSSMESGIPLPPRSAGNSPVRSASRALRSSSSSPISQQRRLENEHRELERQRERFEKFRLREKNRSLSARLTEAEQFIKVHQKDMKDSRNLKSMVGELHTDLCQQLQNKEEQIRILHARITSLEMQVQSNSASSKDAILQLENLVAQREDVISRLVDKISTKRDSRDQEEIITKKLVELTTSFENNEPELEQLRMNNYRISGTISKSEQESERAMKKKEADKGNQSEQSRKEAIRASARIIELKESLQALQNKLYAAEERADDGSQLAELNLELHLVRGELVERDEQLAESRKSIAEAQRMIFRLMNTVQDLRKSAKEQM